MSFYLRRPVLISVVFALVLAAVAAYTLVSVLFWNWIFAALVGLNLVAFFVFGFDKLQSRRRGLRVPERAFHLIALLGGSPGALLGMRVFRHKTMKPWFQGFYVILFLVQAAALFEWWR